MLWHHIMNRTYRKNLYGSKHRLLFWRIRVGSIRFLCSVGGADMLPVCSVYISMFASILRSHNKVIYLILKGNVRDYCWKYRGHFILQTHFTSCVCFRTFCHHSAATQLYVHYPDTSSSYMLPIYKDLCHPHCSRCKFTALLYFVNTACTSCVSVLRSEALCL